MSTAQQKLLVRHAILLQLAAAAPAPLPVATLQQGLRLLGHTTDAATLAAHLDYLAQKQYTHATRSELSSADLRYYLSASGRDYLETQGLA